MDIKNLDFRGMATDELTQVYRSLQLELSDRGFNKRELDHQTLIAQVERLSNFKTQTQQPESQTTIAAKSEAEITARAEKMLAATFNQRVII